jgi:vanillate monooxygenase ferredoxin subunit
MTTVQRTVRIARKTVEAVDISSFELVDPEGQALPAFSAGSHIDVRLPRGLVRQYSLANDPRETHRYLIAVLRAAHSRGGSTGMHALQEGATVEISDPKNNFALADDAQHSILVAGGIGITPILCMAERLSHTGASFELHYCTRSAERAAFAQRIKESSFAGQTRLHHDDGSSDQKFNAGPVIGRPREGTHLYVCGPSGFMEWVLGTAREAGWPDSRLHREYFASVASSPADNVSFEVQLASTGAVIRVAHDQSVVAALAAAGVSVPVSCEQGVCGTCMTRVIDGTPDHRDMYLTPEEQAQCDQFTPCCSRSKSPRLVLDL